jgi:hypothetical protein
VNRAMRCDATNEIIYVGGKNFDYSDWDLLP